MNISIRKERQEDEPAIAALIAAAFAGHPHSEGTEPMIVAALRDAGALTVGLVAQDEAGAILGHAAASPIEIRPAHAGWFGLGPVAVHPARQRQGIGAAMISATLQDLRDRAAAGCTVLGEPTYYRRFGFAQNAGLTLEGVPAEYFMALPLAGPVPAGRVSYHAAFHTPANTDR